VEVVVTSSIYETEPVGDAPPGQDFYNAVVEVETDLEPRALLAACKAIERRLGRVPGGPRHGPRPIDVDLLLIDDLTVGEDDLVVPHREISTRRFVLEPLSELDPTITLPDGRSIDLALASLGSGQRVERVGRVETRS
jgi:2-amino-4-hydroxy-6-hydroxymethyldihydropteridine diphosphokinase